MILRVAMMFLRKVMIVLRGGNCYINRWWNILRRSDGLLLIMLDILIIIRGTMIVNIIRCEGIRGYPRGQMIILVIIIVTH
jgi:hypothetical protein